MAQRYIPENPRKQSRRSLPGEASTRYPGTSTERTLPGGPAGGSYPTGSGLSRGGASRTSGLRGQGLPGGFNSYAAGEKKYGFSGRSAPNVGPTNSPEGYMERDAQERARKAAMKRKLAALKGGRTMQPDVLRSMPR